ncbi:hypothetical protein D8674_017126 [Pyrus ussuriensis x Pyrus communis]|uniref:DUF659 domain-containing protein n=1 Tax=Pyrus ussuriensis x Pyrus communis TaxID=2448454 RepID=A0A5N5HBT9_9ROSA|nr:hypothetical protein D8674_017126 [Pyrus ussuriensis x Pyrus communis]
MAHGGEHQTDQTNQTDRSEPFPQSPPILSPDFHAGIPFHAIDNDNFKRFVEVVGQFGTGYQPSSQYDLREPLLKEESSEAHTGEYIFEYVDKCIEEVGSQNVVQVVIDNSSNNMANKMMEKRPYMFWTSFIEKAKIFTIFIYAYHKTLALMRKYTKKRDIVRLGVTRFPTSFPTLQILVDKKKDLRIMVASDEWEQCKHSKSIKRKTAYATMVSAYFWNRVSLCLRVFELFHEWGVLYGELQKSRNETKEALKNNEADYRPIIQFREF